MVVLPPPAARPACVRRRTSPAQRGWRLQLPPDRASLAARVYNEAGDGLGVVLVDGEAAGAWEARFAGGGGGMQVDLELFERPGALLKKAVEYRFEVAASLLGARSASMD